MIRVRIFENRTLAENSDSASEELKKIERNSKVVQRQKRVWIHRER